MIGPNGAGKSTMFNLITGDVAPDAGRVVFDGEDVTALAPHRALAPGDGALLPDPASLREHDRVREPAGRRDLRRRPRPSAKATSCAEVLRVTGLLTRRNVPAGTLTLLQRKRLELARALAMRPKLLLLDEIAGGLTEHECRELIETIRAIHAQRHHDRLDRAYRACAGLGGEPADRDQFRPDPGRGRRRRP